MNPIRVLILRLRAFLWTAFALSCILLALLVGVASLLLPYVGYFKPNIEQLLGQRLGRPVQLEELQASWTPSGPQMLIHGLSIGSTDEKAAELRVEMANVGYDLYAWLKPDQSGLAYFRLLSERLELIRRNDGRWHLAGLDAMPRQSPSGLALNWLLEQGGISASAQEFVLVDEVLGHRLTLSDANLTLRNHGDHQSLSGTVASPGGDGQVRLELELYLEDSVPRVLGYAEGSGVDLAGWFEGFPVAGSRILDGQAEFEVWGEWSPDRALQLDGNVQLGELILAGWTGLELEEGGRLDTRYSLDLLQSDFRFLWRAADDWQLDAMGLNMSRAGREWPETSLAVAQRPNDARAEFDIAGGFLRVQDLSNALLVFDTLPVGIRRQILQRVPRGDVSDFRLLGLSSSWPMRGQGELTLRAGALESSGRQPAFDNLSGRVILDGQAGRFEIDSEATFVAFPGVLRWPLQLDRLSGVIRWTPLNGFWALDLEQMAFVNEGVEARGRLSMLLGDGSRPFVDGQAEVLSAGVADARRYWPANIFKAPLLDWLDRSLVGGTVRSGELVIYGDMDDWPFDGNEGRFEAVAQVEEGILDYSPLWPRLYDIDARLRFDADGLSGTVPGASVGDMRISQLQADLPSYRSPRLDLGVTGRGSADALLDFLRNSPVQDSHGVYLDGLTASGPSDVQLQLSIPFGQAPGDTRVDGEVALEGSDIEDAKWGVRFESTRGVMRFSREGIAAEGLDTRFRSIPARLTVRTGDFVDQPGLAAVGRLSGKAPAATILQDIPLLQPVADRVRGSSEWQVELRVEDDGQLLPGSADGEGSPKLSISSDLVGASLQLPPPFIKPTEQDMPLTIKLRLPEVASDLRLALGEVASLQVRQDPATGRWSGAVLFGPGTPPPHDGDGLRITGVVDTLNLDDWRDLWDEMLPGELPEGEQQWLQSIDLEVLHLRFAGRDFERVLLTAQRDDSYWNLDLEGEQMSGRLRLPLSLEGNRLMLAEFEHLEWPASDEEMPATGLKPDEIPPLRFFAQDLVFAGVPVGTVSFESYPTSEGMHIDQLETESEVFSLNAGGDWVVSDDRRESRFAATITGEDFGLMLEEFGFSGVVEGGQTLVKLDVRWPGSPAEFELGGLNGDLELSINRGEFVEVEPGAGRIFGLLSLAQIPRRLRLDFADLFRTGMVFDAIEGSFRLDDGNAFTDDVEIRSPTARVLIRGRTGLAERDYNQIITVIPELEDVLPVVGAIAGGGPGAAALLLIQGLFGNQIDRITQYHYSVTGSWEDPDVELLGADGGQLTLDVPDEADKG